MPKKLKVAITGGIGAGKSLVSKIIGGFEYPVIFADQIAKKLLESDKNIQNRIKAAFGTESFINGIPNKQFLAAQIFNDPQNLQKMNNIIHPVTLKIIAREMNELLDKYPMVFVESALIYEAKRESMFDFIILVYAEKQIRIERASQGLSINPEQVEVRMNSQMDEELKRAKADFVIENNSSVADLENRTKLILNILKAISG